MYPGAYQVSGLGRPANAKIGFQKQKQKLAMKVERENLVLSSLPELSVQILEFAREHGRVSAGDVIRQTGISRNTIKLHFRSLVEKKHLVVQGKGRTTWYSLA